MSHEFQHPDEPTWCIHCGTFKENCGDEQCPKAGQRLFDYRDPATAKRMIDDVFGIPAEQKGGE